MGAAERRLALLLISVSGVAALAVALLIEGLNSDQIIATTAGGLLAICAALGIAALGRIVLITERHRSRR